MSRHCVLLTHGTSAYDVQYTRDSIWLCVAAAGTSTELHCTLLCPGFRSDSTNTMFMCSCCWAMGAHPGCTFSWAGLLGRAVMLPWWHREAGGWAELGCMGPVGCKLDELDVAGLMTGFVFPHLWITLTENHNLAKWKGCCKYSASLL